MKKIGMLTSGGDCQALNAAMRGVVKALAHNIDELEIYGFENGYKGLIYENYRILTSKDFSGILTKGGTILGSSRQPFKLMRVPDENGLDKVAAMKNTYKKLGLDCLVILGGNGTQKTANLLREEGLNVIHLPKTIDNDIYGTDVTFGFQSAINIATDAIDCIHTTAASHNRVFIVEVMGHLQDWATQTTGWKLVDFSTKNGPMLSGEEYDLTKLNPDEYADRLFCRERWIKTKLSKTGEELEQRLIVTFSFKYRDYLRHIREKQIARAEQSIKNGTAGKLSIARH